MAWQDKRNDVTEISTQVKSKIGREALGAANPPQFEALSSVPPRPRRHFNLVAFPSTLGESCAEPSRRLSRVYTNTRLRTQAYGGTRTRTCRRTQSASESFHFAGSQWRFPLTPRLLRFASSREISPFSSTCFPLFGKSFISIRFWKIRNFIIKRSIMESSRRFWQNFELFKRVKSF